MSNLSLSNLRIGQKGLLLIGLHLVCELIFFAALTKLLYDANAEQQRQSQAKEVLLRTSQIGLAYERTAHYIMMWSKGSEKYREKSLIGIERLKKISNELETASAFDPSLKSSYEAHRKLLQDIFKHIEVVKQIALKKNQLEDIEHIQNEMSDLGDLTKQFGDWQDEFVARAEHIETESPQKQDKLRRTQYLLISAGLIANLLITLVLFRFFSTSISRRLTVLEENTVRFGHGTRLLPLVGGNDEIKELDATFHKMAEQIEQSRRRQRALTENTADMIFSVSEKMRLSEVNDACSKILHLREEVLLGKDVMSLVSEAVRPQVLEQFESARQSNSPVTCEVKLALEQRDQQDTSWTISWSEPESSWFCVARNIAEQKRLESLRQDFIAMITHDMRSPLTSILSNLQMLGKGAYGPLEPKGSAKTEVMISNCRQLLSFINDLLDVDRLESGVFELEQAPVNTAEIFARATNTVEGAATGRRIEITAPSTGYTVIADEARVVQVLVNLLSNAIKFSDSGSRVEITQVELNDGLEISVTDRGRGIPADKLAVIFERYRQTSADDAKTGSGFGLGLYICKQLLKAHGSDLTVRSRENEGSTFAFTLKKTNA